MCQTNGIARNSLNGWRDLMRRYTQRRDARNGQQHTLAEDIRMAALEELLPEGLERHCQRQRSRLDMYQKLREEVAPNMETRGCVAPKLGQVSKAREDRDDAMDVGGFGQRTGHFQREGEELHWQSEKENEKGSVRSLQDNRTRKKNQGQCWNCGKNCSSIDGLLGINRTKDNQMLLGKDTTRKVNLAKVERKANPQMRELSCGLCRLLHRRMKQTQLAR